MDETIYSKAIMIFHQLKNYRDSAEQLQYCEAQQKIARTDALYKKGVYFSQREDKYSLQKAIDCFNQILNYKDSQVLRDAVESKLRPSNETEGIKKFFRGPFRYKI